MTKVENRLADPYLAGNYAPVGDELDVDDLAVAGQLPDGLNGMFVRNGPNPQFEPLGKYHIFDGDAMVHGVTIADGRASYRNRWIVSKGLVAERRAGHALYGGVASFTLPDPEVLAESGPMKNTGNTSIVRHAGQILALLEACPPTRLGADLATLGEWDFDGRLVGPMTAHPKIDPDTGEMLFFGYSPVPPYLRYHVADASGALVRSVDIDLPAPVMIHDFVVTTEHVVFLDSPAVFSLESLLAGGPMVSWVPENGTRVGVMPRDGDAGDLRWFETDNCYIFHFLNAWAEGSRIQIDASRASAMNLGFADEDRIGDGDAWGVAAQLSRFTVDLDAGRASWEQLDDHPGDFPRIDDRVAGRKNRFGYVAWWRDDRRHLMDFDRVAKYDVTAGTSTSWSAGPNGVLGEPVFAPDPAGRSEDDGWVLAFAHDTSTDQTDLVVLDARDVAAGPVARVRMPRRVPYGFHGAWLAAD